MIVGDEWGQRLPAQIAMSMRCAIQRASDRPYGILLAIAEIVLNVSGH